MTWGRECSELQPLLKSLPLLVKCEIGIADDLDRGDRWSLDHLFIDQDGVPTLVEVKRSTDRRIRREVVGQMLDYAVVHWSVEKIQREFCFMGLYTIVWIASHSCLRRDIAR